ncbi:MAG: hypothetical protein ACJ8G2_01770 [Burkholderiales bacterium]|jgi:hypothetical protein
MDYRVYSMSTGEEDNSTEAHVFARAYRGAWRSIHGSEPVGRHHLSGVGLVFDFGTRAWSSLDAAEDRPVGRNDH